VSRGPHSGCHAAVPPRVAFQGEPGAFSELAIAAQWPQGAEAVPCPTFGDALAALTDGRAEFAVIPVENAIAGAVTVALEAMAPLEGRLVQVAERRVAIHLALLALPGASLDQVTHVHSHPVALAQCRLFLAKHPALTAVSEADTAGAARLVAERGDAAHAAIAGASAAARYGLVPLRAQVEDVPANWTRFVVVARGG
jgi:prephenate dehydratase